MKKRVIPIPSSASICLLLIAAFFMLMGQRSVVSAETSALTIIDDFNDENVDEWFAFNGGQGGGGRGIATDRPQEGAAYLSTGWGGTGNGGFYGGTGKNFENNAQIALPVNPEFSVWVYNQSDATSDGYTLEITLREDVEGDGWNGNGGTDDSFRLDTVFTSADYSDQWVQIKASIADFAQIDGTGDGTFDGNLDELVIVVAGVQGGDPTTVEVDFDQLAFDEGPPPPVVIDDFNDENADEWFAFNGGQGGGGRGIATDRPYEGAAYLSTGWGGTGNGGFYGGTGKNFDNAAQITPPDDAWLSFWVYNQSDATSDGYTLEFTIREDVEGDGWNGNGGTDDSFRLDTVFTSADYNDRWVQITAAVADLPRIDGTGDGTFNGNLDELVIVIAGVQGGDPTTVEVDFDYLTFTSGNPVTTPSVAFANSQYSASEGDTATVDVTLSAAAADTVTVTYATSDGSATAGTDYTTATGQLVFAAGETTQSFTVDTIDNSDDDDDRTVILALSDADNATVGLPSSATLTIIDDEMTAPSSKGLIIEDYESGTLIVGQDAFSNTVGYDFFSGGSSTVDIALTDAPPAPRPGAEVGNSVLQEDLFITAGSFSGFSYRFPNATADEWVSQDWSSYAGIGFWLYGNNTGGVIFLDIQDNRNPGSTTDDAGRYSVDLQDNFSGWQYFELTWDQFNYKGINNGAPNDGFTLDEINGYAFGGFGSAPIDNSYYIDNIRLIKRVDIVDDFEDGMLPMGQDANSVNIGFANFAGNGGAINLAITDMPIEQVPDAPASNKVVVADMTLPQNSFAGFSHAFANEAVDEWVPADWVGYEGVCFWLYGHSTGGTLFFDVLDNRNDGSTGDDAERFSVNITDDFSGWQFFQYTWDEFGRKEIGNGAPNDGFTLTEVHGYAVGGAPGSAVDMGQNDYYVDNVAVWGNSGADQPLTAQFEVSQYEVTEGETATVSVELSRASTDVVTVRYASAESIAVPNRDFVPVAGDLMIPAGETTASFTVETIDELKDDGDKNLMLVLLSAENAELGFARQTALNILDNEATDVNLVDDFAGWHPYQTMGDISLMVTEIPSDSADAVPGQGDYEHVLEVSYNTSPARSGTASTGFTRTFSEPQDWSGSNGLSFWFYGSNSGETYTVELKDNQAGTTTEIPASDWTLVWSDEFNDAAGSQPNSTDWDYELGDGSLNGIPGWGNGEFQYYSDDPANVAMDGAGNLALSLLNLAEDTELVCYYGPCLYTSARILTKGKTEFEYGRIEARIQVPDGEDGLWPAFWTLGGDIDQVGWPVTGEIDIMEYVSRVPNEIFGTIHGPGYNGGAAFGNTYNVGEPVSNDYHTYAIEWSEDEIRWYFDGQGIGEGINYHNAVPADVTPNDWAFNDDPFFMLLNMAIGGNFGGAISDQLTFPQTMLVDYVRVYQAPDSAERYSATFVDDFSGWREMSVPFAAFDRSTAQPANAPDDGLGLTEVWGYSFIMPEDSDRVAGELKLDEVRTVSDATAASVTATESNSTNALAPIVLLIITLSMTIAVFALRKRQVN